MSRNSSGVYSLPAGNPVTTGTTISSTWANTTLSDIATALTQSIAYNGVTTPIANLPMGGYKLTGLGVATTSGDALSYGNAITASSIVGTSVTDSGLTSGRVTYASTGGLLADSASLTFDGTNLGIANINGATLSLKTGGTTGLYIDASQNVGIGTSSPGAILHTIKTSAGAATVGAFLQNSDTTVGTETRLAFAANGNVLSADRYGWIGYINTGGTNGGALTFATTPGGQAATERMRIDSSGNVGIGTSSPTTYAGAKFTVYGSQPQFAIGGGASTSGQLFVLSNGNTSTSSGLAIGQGYNSGTDNVAYISNNANADLLFRTNATERMRIDSSGNVLVGVTSPGSYAAGSAIGTTGYISRNGTGGSFSNNRFNIYWNGSAARLWIDTVDQGSIAIVSDYRIKKNIESQTESALDKIAKLRPVTYTYSDYKPFSWKADGIVREGFIAHELAEIIPSAVDGEKDAENKIQSLRLDAIVSVLTKAIQEQQALITQLQADVAVLKGAK